LRAVLFKDHRVIDNWIFPILEDGFEACLKVRPARAWTGIQGKTGSARRAGFIVILSLEDFSVILFLR